jgi:hypothetical protein
MSRRAHSLALSVRFSRRRACRAARDEIDADRASDLKI